MKLGGRLAALGLVLLAGCTCNSRTLEGEPPPPDIEGLCRASCERFMECVWAPDIGTSFSTMEGCVESCQASPAWDEAGCAERREALLACITQYECPEFAAYGCQTPDSQCCKETMEHASCP